MVIHLYSGVSFPYRYLVIEDMHVLQLFSVNEHELQVFCLI